MHPPDNSFFCSFSQTRWVHILEFACLPPPPYLERIAFRLRKKENATRHIKYFSPFSSLARGQIRCLPFPRKKNFIDPSLSHGVHVPQLFFWPEKHSSPQKNILANKSSAFLSSSPPPFNLLHAFLSLFLFFPGKLMCVFFFSLPPRYGKLTAAKEIAKVFAASNNAHNYTQTHTTYNKKNPPTIIAHFPLSPQKPFLTSSF